jgi:C1A family cysteine protease
MPYNINGYRPTPSWVPYNKFSVMRGGMTKLAFARMAATPAANPYIISEKVPCFDQGQLGSCVANSTCGALEILQGVEGVTITPLSRLFVYWNARSYDHDTNVDQGTFIHNAFDSLMRFGICPESEWPYVEAAVFTQPPTQAYKVASDNEVPLSNFYRIDSTGDQRIADVEMAIRANHPVVFGTQVSQQYESWTGGTNVWQPPTNPAGGHAQCIVGVRRNPDIQFLVRNSWGTGWGDTNYPGHAWFSSAYIAADMTNDLWVPTRVEALVP